MTEPRLHEDFSTTLLCMFFALARENATRAHVLGLEITLADGHARFGDLFPLNEATEVWMCRDLYACCKGDEGTAEELKRIYGGKKPDVWVEDARHLVFIENKVGGGREVAQQESPYLRFLSERETLRDKKTGFLYAVPEAWTLNPACEWLRFTTEPHKSVIRGLLKWDRALVSLLIRTFNVPQWFHDRLPHRIGEQYL